MSTYNKYKDLWLEFLVPVKIPLGQTEYEVNLCGFCGNQGVVTIAAVSPAGVCLGDNKFFCICPNGRASKKKKTGTKYGGTSKT